jgi:MarR family transcriptional regulator, temperature-dependent positive regulator of motility
VSDTSGKATITLIAQLTKLVHRRTSEELLGMPWRHFIALSALADRSSMSQQSLCESIVMDPNNCVLLLNELETLAYVERNRDPTDRRRHIVAITEQGRDAFDRAQAARATVEDDVLATLDAGERQTLRQLLVKALEG